MDHSFSACSQNVGRHESPWPAFKLRIVALNSIARSDRRCVATSVCGMVAPSYREPINQRSSPPLSSGCSP
jgi:hypothetical protein